MPEDTSGNVAFFYAILLLASVIWTFVSIYVTYVVGWKIPRYQEQMIEHLMAIRENGTAKQETPSQITGDEKEKLTRIICDVIPRQNKEIIKQLQKNASTRDDQG